MPDGKDYWLKETYRHLTLAAIGAQGKSREHLENAMECLEKHEEEVKVLREKAWMYDDLCK